MTRDEKIKMLELEAIKEGLGETPICTYPAALTFRWLSRAYPAIWGEFMEWFDDKIRGIKL